MFWGLEFLEKVCYLLGLLLVGLLGFVQGLLDLTGFVQLA